MPDHVDPTNACRWKTGVPVETRDTLEMDDVRERPPGSTDERFRRLSKRDAKAGLSSGQIAGSLPDALMRQCALTAPPSERSRPRQKSVPVPPVEGVGPLEV